MNKGLVSVQGWECERIQEKRGINKVRLKN